MKPIKLRALRVYDAITVNKKKESYLIAGEFVESKEYSQKKYLNLILTFLPDINSIELKDTSTKYHILVPITNVAEMLLPGSEWSVYTGKKESKEKEKESSKAS